MGYYSYKKVIMTFIFRIKIILQQKFRGVITLLLLPDNESFGVY